MITQTQINELRKVATEQAVLSLLLKYENDLFMKEKSKKGKIEITLKDLKGQNPRTIIATDMGNGYAFHKDAFGGSFHVLSHIATGTKVLTGKRNICLNVSKSFLDWEGCKILCDAITAHKLDALRYVPDEITAQYRKFFEAARKD